MCRRRASVPSGAGDGFSNSCNIVPYCACQNSTMTRIVMVLAATLALTAASPAPEPPSVRSISNNILRTDITPEEAQQYLNSPPFTAPQLSSKIATLPLVRWDDPRFRSAESGPTNGHYWKNGREIENTNDYDEEVYDAQQFHGQDGLGAYAYGYKAPESSKVENRARSGDVNGAYEFIAGNNDIIKVRYWADSEGFHQEDNVPRDLPKPPEEPEDVRQARLAHEKAWQEAAAAAAQNPDPQGAYNPNSESQYQAFPQYQQSASEQRSVLAAPSSDSFQREGKSYQNYQDNPCSQCNSVQPAQIGPEDKSSENNPCALCNGAQPAQIETQQAPKQGSQMQVQLGQQIGLGQTYGQSNQMQVQTGPLQGQSSQQQPQYALPQGQQQQQGPSEQQQRQSRQQALNGIQNLGEQRGQYQQQPEEPEPTGPPRGFFYSFNYPVSILTRKGGEQDSGPFGAPGQQGQFGNQGQQSIDSDTVGVNAQRA